MPRLGIILLTLLLLLGVFGDEATAKNPYRSDFFAYYPTADGTQLAGLEANTKHCGVCHLDFNGGGARNAYGFQVEIARNNGMTNEQAFLSIEGDDADLDGFTNLTEITSTLFDNTPTFPGLSEDNYRSTLNIPLEQIVPFLEPTGGDDTTPPEVVLSYPVGGEVLQAGTTINVLYTATDLNGISHVNLYLSDDSGSEWITVAMNQPHTGSLEMFVVNMPGDFNRVKVEAYDNAANEGDDESAADFSILPQLGIAPTTLRDMKFFGTQPHAGRILEDPDATCATCHGNYDTPVEPWYNWKGSMMGQAMRDPLFLACVTIAEQDAPSVGDICIRCHTPGGWVEGRSDDTSGGMINEVDRQGVQCDFCHAAVDWDYVSGLSPQADSLIVAAIDPPLMDYANGSFIIDPNPVRRGPRADAQADHDFLESPIHRKGEFCGTCHDVSNPVLWRDGGAEYSLTSFDEEHPTGRAHAMGPVERTYSEWTQSEYAAVGVYAPQFAGNKPDGMVSTCQDCHMSDVRGQAAIGGPTRDDLAQHDLTGGNTFLPDIIADFFPTEVDQAHLDAGKLRARAMLQKGVSLELIPQVTGVTVKITNETGHKMPSGYPEGRRMWLHVKAVDENGATVFSSGVWNPGTGELPHDEALKLYEVKPGISQGLADILSFPAGPSFHFVLSDTVFSDNRIPPRGFTNAAFESVQSPVVGYTYADGQYWDETEYTLPLEADSVFVSVLYQTTNKEYIEFLRDENHTDTMGQQLYDAWVTQGMNPPELMAHVRAEVAIESTPTDPVLPSMIMFSPGQPNPFGSNTRFAYSLPREAMVEIAIYDLRGRKVQTLRNEVQPAGQHFVHWDGRDHNGSRLASGIYLVRMVADNQYRTQRVTLMR